MTAKGYKGSLRGDHNVLEFTVVVLAQLVTLL